MAVAAEYTREGAVLRYEGKVTGEEILDAKARFFSHGFPLEPRYVLCDFSAVEKLDVTADDVLRIVRQDLAAVAEHPDLAEVVVAPQPLQYGLARMWEQQVVEKRTRTAVVMTEKEALDWLRGLGIRMPRKS